MSVSFNSAGAWIRWVAGVLVMAAGVQALPASASPPFPFHVMHELAVPGQGPLRAMTFSADGNEAFVAAGHAITAYATDREKPRATQAFDGQVTALAMSTHGKFLYATTRGPSRLLVLDPQTLRIERRKILDDASPSGMFADEGTHAIYVIARDSHDILRLSASSLKVEGITRLDRAIGQVVSNLRGHLYTTTPGHAGIHVIDARSMRRLDDFGTPDCTPTGALAMDTVGRRLFIACRSGQLAILDTDMGFLFRRIQLGNVPGKREVFAFRPAPGSGWKGGLFVIAGRQVESVRMNAFVRYAYGGSLALPGPVQDVALSPKAGQLWVSIGKGTAANSKAKDAHAARIIVLAATGDQP